LISMFDNLIGRKTIKFGHMLCCQRKRKLILLIGFLECNHVNFYHTITTSTQVNIIHLDSINSILKWGTQILLMVLI
jgi:hypothetical protein